MLYRNAACSTDVGNYITPQPEKEIGGDNAMTEFPNYLTDPEEPQHDDSCQWKEFVPAASVVIYGTPAIKRLRDTLNEEYPE